jgi:hypothetical protein
MHEKKRGEVRCPFANPILGKVEDVHYVHSYRGQKVEFLFRKKPFGGTSALLVSLYGVFPNPLKIRIEVVAQVLG